MHSHTLKIKILLQAVDTVVLYEHKVNTIVHTVRLHNVLSQQVSSVIKSFLVTLVVSIKGDFGY